MLKLKPSQWDTLWFALLMAVFILPGATSGHPTAVAVLISLAIATWFRASVNAESRRPRWMQFIATFLILCAAMILTKGAAKDKWGLTDGPVQHDAAEAAKVKELNRKGVQAYVGNHLDEAKAAWEEALKLDPANVEVAKSLERVNEKLKARSAGTK